MYHSSSVTPPEISGALLKLAFLTDVWAKTKLGIHPREIEVCASVHRDGAAWFCLTPPGCGGGGGGAGAQLEDIGNASRTVVSPYAIIWLLLFGFAMFMRVRT